MIQRATVIKRLAYLGAAIRQGGPSTGVERGPQLIRDSGAFKMLQQIYGTQVIDYGDIGPSSETKVYPPINHPIKNLNILGPVLGRLHEKITTIMASRNEEVLLTVGGDHSIGTATVTGALRVHPDLKVVWVDGHTDCKNWQIRTPHIMHNENYHGMPLAHVSGMITFPELPCWQWLKRIPYLNPRNIVLIGIRDIHPDEYITMNKWGVRCYTMDHVDQYGIGEVMRQTIEYLDPKKESPFHLSFDVDGIDPEFVGQTGALCRYGLSGRQSLHIVRRLVHSTKLVSMDINEINQEADLNEPKRKKKFRGENALNDVSKSVGMGVDLMASLCTRYFEL